MKGRQNASDSKTGIGRVLIPVDFSQKCDLAVKFGFEIARRLDIDATLLHASPIPVPSLFPQFPEDYNGVEDENSEIEEMEVSDVIHKNDERQMKLLKEKIASLQADGSLPPIDFNTVVSSGMPEEVIVEYCGMEKPKLIVMATRNRTRRQEELMGSVTAEVIDNARVPIFSVPEDYHYFGIKEIVRICVFCHLDGNDFDSVNALMRMFESPSLNLWLFPVTDRMKSEEKISKMTALQESLSKAFPKSEFHVVAPDEKDLRTSVVNLFRGEDIQMILVPNRKRNVFARFFRPGLAHKILFEKDIPMFVVPV